MTTRDEVIEREKIMEIYNEISPHVRDFVKDSLLEAIDEPLEEGENEDGHYLEDRRYIRDLLVIIYKSKHHSRYNNCQDVFVKIDEYINNTR